MKEVCSILKNKAFKKLDYTQYRSFICDKKRSSFSEISFNSIHALVAAKHVWQRLSKLLLSSNSTKVAFLWPTLEYSYMFTKILNLYGFSSFIRGVHERPVGANCLLITIDQKAKDIYLGVGTSTSHYKLLQLNASALHLVTLIWLVIQLRGRANTLNKALKRR